MLAVNYFFVLVSIFILNLVDFIDNHINEIVSYFHLLYY